MKCPDFLCENGFHCFYYKDPDTGREWVNKYPCKLCSGTGKVSLWVWIKAHLTRGMT